MLTCNIYVPAGVVLAVGGGGGFVPPPLVLPPPPPHEIPARARHITNTDIRALLRIPNKAGSSNSAQTKGRVESSSRAVVLVLVVTEIVTVADPLAGIVTDVG